MTDLLILIIAGAATWAVLVSLFIIGRNKQKKTNKTNDWAQRKRARFPIGGIK